MPNGPTHRKLTRIALVVSLPAAISLKFAHSLLPTYYVDYLSLVIKDKFTVWDFLWFGVGVILTHWFDPDLDLRHRLGVVGDLMGLEAYQRLVPHRAGLRKSNWNRFDWKRLFFFSHIPFVGTLLRTMIVITPFLFLFLFFSIIEYFPWSGIFWVWVGMSYSDMWHVGADIIVSDLKRREETLWINSKRLSPKSWDGHVGRKSGSQNQTWRKRVKK